MVYLCTMNWFDRIRNIKFLLVTFAVFIAIVSLVTSNYLIQDLKAGEINSVEVWAEAMRSLNNADENTDLNLVLKDILIYCSKNYFCYSLSCIF